MSLSTWSDSQTVHPSVLHLSAQVFKQDLQKNRSAKQGQLFQDVQDPSAMFADLNALL